MPGHEVLGYDLAVYILPAVVAVLLAAGVPLLRAGRRLGRIYSEARYPASSGLSDGAYHLAGGWVLTGAAAVMLIITLISAIPYDARYWRWYLVTAEVGQVSNTLRDASGDLTTTPVVTVEGLDRPVTVDDPRIVTMTGQSVVLSCQPAWHFRAADSYSCRIYSYEGATR